MHTVFKIKPGGALRGAITVPGDKSISHRAVMLAALAEGQSTISGFLPGEDTRATVNVFRQLGVEIIERDKTTLIVKGVGMRGLRAPQRVLDFGNAGTGIRLVSGILSAQPFDSELTGDASLQKRPMGRIVEPLSMMGAKISATRGKPPLKISGGRSLKGITYETPVASAQVKSAILLAGLFAEGETEVIEPAVTRNHTEKLLQSFGYAVDVHSNYCTIRGGAILKAIDLNIPADISSAAFFMVGATIAKGSSITLRHVGINKTRLGVIKILTLMGADIEIKNESMCGEEPVADIHVKSVDTLLGIDIPLDQVPLAIDEFPALFIAAACAKGTTVLRGAEELRVKETDRLQVMSEGLMAVGVENELREDGIVIEGGKIKGGRVNSHGDHRVAMAFAIAGLVAEGEITVDDCANVATSFPSFVDIAQKAGLQI